MIPSDAGPDLQGFLFASLIIGSVGLGLFLYGKKQRRWPQLITGFILMAFPYFEGNLWWMSGIAVALLMAMAVVLRLGW